LHSVVIPRFEKNVVFALIRIFFQSKIHAVFFRHVLKALDVLLIDLNVFNTNALAHKLLHTLFTVVDFRIMGLRQILPNSPFEQIGGQPAASLAHLDCQGYGFIPHFVLHGDLPPSCKQRHDSKGFCPAAPSAVFFPQIPWSI
jgi:hypothetical protein